MTPAYNLRVGKAADRLLFRDMLARIAGTLDLSEYRYVGLGGPFLEDFRLLREAFPTIKLSSIEKNRQVWRRQGFHTPGRDVKLHQCAIDHYFANIHDDSERVVVWLDYTGLNYRLLQEVWTVIQRLHSRSVVRITLRAEGPDDVGHEERQTWVQQIFGPHLPDYAPSELEGTGFPSVLLRGIRKVINSATSDLAGVDFQLLNAVHYDDGTRMMTVTGILGDAAIRREIRQVLRQWEFRNFNWAKPIPLVLPALSLKERLTLEPLLPSRRGTGKALHQKLGYSIEETKSRSLTALDNYRRLSEAYPRFVRIAF